MRLELNEPNYVLCERIIRNQMPVEITETTHITLWDGEEARYSVDTAGLNRSEVVRKVRSLLELYA